ncbi:MAG TPA: CoA pyrophosphatase [Dehalococcoidia bacterium]|nr:CoA pyrophosphatase [Dehalococcoidia bacterium]
MIEEIKRRLAEYSSRPSLEPWRAKASVLVPLHQHSEDVFVVLTKRSEKVASHKGEISFPGGAVDPTDPDLRFTALRESHEEIGLAPSHVRIVGQLDEIVTISNYHVTPYVGEIDPSVSPYEWRHEEFEVAEILEVPLSHLIDPENAVEMPRMRDGQMVLQPGIRFGEHIVWGATWRILRNFLDVAVMPQGSAPVEGPTGAASL